jgi:hypothetical protein
MKGKLDFKVQNIREVLTAALFVAARNLPTVVIFSHIFSASLSVLHLQVQ